MLDSIQSLLDTFPEGVIRVRDGMTVAVNGMAAHYLPQLEPGEPLPEEMTLPRGGPSGAGAFTAGSVLYTYSCTDVQGEQMILFRPAAQTAFTDRQLDGALRQLPVGKGGVGGGGVWKELSPPVPADGQYGVYAQGGRRGEPGLPTCYHGPGRALPPYCGPGLSPAEGEQGYFGV